MIKPTKMNTNLNEKKKQKKNKTNKQTKNSKNNNNSNNSNWKFSSWKTKQYI